MAATSTRLQAGDAGTVRATLERALEPSATEACLVCGARLDPADGIWVGCGGLVLCFCSPDCAGGFISHPDHHAGGARAGRSEDR